METGQRAGADLDRVRRSQLLEAHLPDLVDYKFTAAMEDELDAISRGELIRSNTFANSISAKIRRG